MKKLLTPKQSYKILNFIKEEVYSRDIVEPKIPIKIRFSVEYVTREK